MDFTFLNGSTLLSDFTITIVEGADGKGREAAANLPVHGVVLAAASKYYRTLLSNWRNGKAADASCLTLTVDEGAAPAAMLLLSFMYTGILPENIDQATLMKILQLADYLQCPGAVVRCLRLLSEKAESDLDWDTAAAILSLPEGFALSAGASVASSSYNSAAGDALSAVCSITSSPNGSTVNDKRTGGDGGAAGGVGSVAAVQPHQQYWERAVSIAQRKVLAELGDLEAAWRNPARRARFLALPAGGVVHLLGHLATAVASENTVLIAVASWAAARNADSSKDDCAACEAAHATQAELDALFGLVRLQHLTASCLAGIVPQIRWFWDRLIGGCSGTGVGPVRQLLCHLRAAKAGQATSTAFAGRPGQAMLRASSRPRSPTASELSFTWELEMDEVRAAIASVRATRERRNLRSKVNYFAGYHCALALNLHAAPAPLSGDAAGGTGTVAAAAAVSGYRAFLGILIEAVKDGPLQLENDDSVMVAVLRGVVTCQRVQPVVGSAAAAAGPESATSLADTNPACPRAAAVAPCKSSRYTHEGPTLGGSWGVMDFFEVDSQGEARWADFTIGGRLHLTCTLGGLE